MEEITIHKVKMNRFLFFIKIILLDENQFRQMVVWLEDMKIRLYPIDGRQNLRDTQNPRWEETLSKVIF
jgi:hypothetical protein